MSRTEAVEAYRAAHKRGLKTYREDVEQGEVGLARLDGAYGRGALHSDRYGLERSQCNGCLRLVQSLRVFRRRRLGF